MRRTAAVTLLAAGLLAGQTNTGADSSDLYYLVFLRPKPDRTKLAQADGVRIQAAHMANIQKMADDGVLAAAGPFEDNPTTISGVFVLTASSLDRAKAIAGSDPTVVEHRNTVDVHPWRGPKGIGAEYFRLHKDVPNSAANMQVHPFCLMYSASQASPAVVAAHDDYIKRLRGEKKLGAAGSVDEKELTGVLIFNVMPIGEAEALLQMDPAVKSGALRCEMHRWWSADHVLPW